MSKTGLKASDQKKKALYKPILESPYSKPAWPEISSEDSRTLVDLLSSLLSPIGQFKQFSDKSKLIKPPDILEHCVFGFNETNATLEAQARQHYGLENRKKSENTGKNENIQFNCIIVCRSDIKNSLLLHHFPMLSLSSRAKLIQLPKGTSTKLSLITGYPHLTVLAIKSSLDSPLFHQIVGKVEKVHIPWLAEHPLLEHMVVRKLKTVAGEKRKASTKLKIVKEIKNRKRKK